MHTLETAIILPAILFFVAVIICISLKYTDMVSQHADKNAKSVPEELISHTDVVRGGTILSELCKSYSG